MFKLFNVCLKLFDGGTDGGAAAGGEANGGEAQGATHDTRGSKSGGLDKVIYGKANEENSSDAGSEGKADISVTSDTAENRRARYNALINGEFKDLYTQDTQRMINRRFAETKSLEKQLNAHKPIIDTLLSKYKITDGDIEKLSKAVEQDDIYYEEGAAQAGMTVEQYREFERVKRENEQLRNAEKQLENQRSAQRQLQQWVMDGEALKGIYPEFDLETESQNPQFLALLKSGIPVQHAYEVLHMEEIKSGLIDSVSKTTEKRVVDNIKAKGTRPAENGVSAQNGAFTYKRDVSKLTKADRAEIARRAQRGETIEF